MVDRYQEQQARDYSYHARAESDDDGLRVEYPRDILLGGTNRAEYSDLLGPFKNGDVCDDSDHDGRYDQRYRDESDEHVADRICDVLYRFDQNARDVGVADDHVLVAVVLHLLVVVIDELEEVFLRLEVLEVERHRVRFVDVGVAELHQVGIVTGLGAARYVCGDESCDLIFVHLHGEGVRDARRVDIELASDSLCSLAECRSYDLRVLHHLYAFAVLVDALLYIAVAGVRSYGLRKGIPEDIFRLKLLLGHVFIDSVVRLFDERIDLRHQHFRNAVLGYQLVRQTAVFKSREEVIFRYGDPRRKALSHVSCSLLLGGCRGESIKQKLRSEKVRWKCFRTRVRFPPLPPLNEKEALCLFFRSIDEEKAAGAIPARLECKSGILI